MFTGSHDITMDGKGRLSLPSRWREPFLERDAQRRLYLVNDPERPCCTLFPFAQFRPKLEQLAGSLNLIDSSAQIDRIRDITAGAVPADFDEQWRTVIPPSIRKALGLGGGLVAIGVVDRIELWDPGVWKEFQETRRARLS